MYIGIHCIDSWHLANGIHCPNLSTYTADDIDTLLKYMKVRIEDCVAEDKDYNPCVHITPEYIKEKCEEKNGDCCIYFVKPREGYIQIINTDNHIPTIKVGSIIHTPNECELTVYAVDDSDFDNVTIKAKWMKKR